MTNSKLLLALIEESGLKRSYIARTLDITTYSLAQKIHNIREFKASEIAILCRVLGIKSSKTIKDIFFAKDVDLKSSRNSETTDNHCG